VTIDQTIALALSHLENGSRHSFAAILTSAIRSSLSARAIRRYRQAIRDAGYVISPSAGDCPIADDVRQAETCRADYALPRSYARS
jgi:hypothetical protein